MALGLRRSRRRAIIVTGWHQRFTQRQRDAVHETRVIALRQQLRACSNGVKQRLKPFRVGLGKIAENMAVNQLLDARVADTDPDSSVFFADMLVERSDAVMASGAAAG